MTRPVAVPVSIWMEAVRSDLRQAAAAAPGLSLTLEEVLTLTATLGDIAEEVRLLERRAEQAPQLPAHANVLQFTRATVIPTDNGAA